MKRKRRRRKATSLRSAKDWLRLPILELEGEIVELYVLAVGALMGTESQARASGVRDPAVVQGPDGPRAVLGTVTVKENGEATLYRLPSFLAEWALDAMAAANAGVKPYPCTVRFHVGDEDVEISYPGPADGDTSNAR